VASQGLSIAFLNQENTQASKAEAGAVFMQEGGKKTVVNNRGK
jgi:hypothetical protein